MARSITRPRGLPEGSNRTWALAASVGLAVIAAIFAFAALRAAGGSDSGSGTVATTPVVVASHEIKPGGLVPLDALRIANVPADAVMKSALTSLDGLAPNLVARSGLEEGEQVSAEKLGINTLGTRIAPPLGMRAVPVSVTEDKIFGGLLAPGDRVDVIFIPGGSSNSGANPPLAHTLVSNVEVAAVGDKALQSTANLDKDGNPIRTDTATGVTATTPGDTSSTPNAKSVALIMFPDDAAKVINAQEQGSVWLSLRAPGDPDVKPVAPQGLPQ